MMVFVPRLWRESGFTEPRMSRRNLLIALQSGRSNWLLWSGAAHSHGFKWSLIPEFGKAQGKHFRAFSASIKQHKVNFHTKRQNSVQWSVATASTTVVLFLKDVLNKIQQHFGHNHWLYHFLVLQEGQKGSQTEAESRIPLRGLKSMAINIKWTAENRQIWCWPKGCPCQVWEFIEAYFTLGEVPCQGQVPAQQGPALCPWSQLCDPILPWRCLGLNIGLRRALAVFGFLGPSPHSLELEFVYIVLPNCFSFLAVIS